MKNDPRLDHRDIGIWEHKIMKRNKKKERKSIKEKFNPKINIYDSRGRIIGSLRQRESINYQELLLKKAEGIHKIKRG